MVKTYDFPFTPDKIPPTNRRIATAREIKERIKQARLYIQSHPPVAKLNKKGYIFYCRKENQELFNYLELCGFFDFHQTNKAKAIVMAHQVSKYIFGSGWKYYLKGYVCLQHMTDIHHLDGDITNNDPRNLAYVSPQVNKLCAQACNLEYFGKVKNLMCESMHQAAAMLALTVRRTYKRLHNKIPNISAIQWLLTLPDVDKVINPVWQIPTPILNLLHSP